MAMKQTQKVNSGLINTGLMGGAVMRPNKPKMTPEELRRKIERDRARDSELVVGIFKNLENPRGSMMFNFRYYHNDPVDIYEMRDGERYQIPRGVARHLNNNCFYKEYRHLRGEFGDTGVRAGNNPEGRLRAEDMVEHIKIHRTAFYPLDFTDDELDLYPSKLVEVNTVLSPL